VSIDRECERFVHLGWDTWGTATPVPLPAEERLRVRLGELALSVGVGTSSGLRMRHGLARVHWPLVLDVSDDAFAAAVRGLTRRGVLRAEGRSLTIPWEALPAYCRSPGLDHGPVAITRQWTRQGGW